MVAETLEETELEGTSQETDFNYSKMSDTAGQLGKTGGLLMAVLMWCNPDAVDADDISDALSDDLGLNSNSIISLVESFVGALMQDSPGGQNDFFQQLRYDAPQNSGGRPSSPSTSRYAGMDQQDMCNAAFDDFIDHLRDREGVRNDVYRDSEGKLTVGVGHLVTASDGLRFGQRISDAQVEEFLEEDAREAFMAAQEQAFELGIYDYEFVSALASVNYQLGCDWNQEHTQTWNLMRQGRWNEAAVEAADSTWNAQTPVRVRDFQQALNRVDDTNDGVSQSYTGPQFA